MSLIGREKEQSMLLDALESKESEMISIIGRRRVGKTFLVQETYNDKIAFSLTGVQHFTREEQLRNFANQLKRKSKINLLVKPPKDWLEAIFVLIEYLENIETEKKIIVFFDEVPWLSSHNSGFLKALSYFWNSWAVQNKNVIVVLCGSSASWMIQKILRNKGGLHNRVTKRIRLTPFTLYEANQYLQSRNIRLSQAQLVQLYAVMGGIPHYLKAIEAGKSAAQNINSICFESQGLLVDEFESLYPALFDSPTNHIALIRALAESPYGMLRKKMVERAKLTESGRITTVLEELETSGFIESYSAFGKKKKEKMYRLVDEYSLFYLKFMENRKSESSDSWLSVSQSQRYAVWSGYAFENICLRHKKQIIKALGIQGIEFSTSSFFFAGDENTAGAQIDLVIDRSDKCINLVEIKFYNKPFALTKEVAQNLKQKIDTFSTVSKTKKHLFLSFVSSNGFQKNEHSLGLVDHDFSMEILFER